MKIVQLPTNLEKPWTMRAVCSPRVGAPNPNGCRCAVELTITDLFKVDHSMGPFKSSSICWKCPICSTDNYLKSEEVPTGEIQSQASFLFSLEAKLVKELMQTTGSSLYTIAAEEGFDERTIARLMEKLCGTIE